MGLTEVRVGILLILYSSIAVVALLFGEEKENIPGWITQPQWQTLPPPIFQAFFFQLYSKMHAEYTIRDTEVLGTPFAIRELSYSLLDD